jgi:thiamine-phosphate pyrophosphorylase
LREVAHGRDVQPRPDRPFPPRPPALGLDGVHLTTGARHVRAARKELGPDAIVGAHAGMPRGTRA